MSKRQTSKSRRRTRQQVLEVRVLSPRIAWFGFLKLFGFFAKIACILAVITGIGWGVWQGIQRAFYQNPDFRLQVIDLNPNSVIDEADVAQIADINLTASLFEIDVTQVAARLKQQPGIADASAERHLPGKLVVRVTPRIPKAWLFHMDSDASAVRKVGAMLVDQTGIAYPCPEMQLTSALSLPIIYLPLSEQVPIAAGQKITLPELDHCFRLLDSAIEADPDSIQWIESIKQINQWSLELATRQGTKATFGLGDHDRQMHSFRAAIDHASQKSYTINTINLIPKHNIPVTVSHEVPTSRRPATPDPGSKPTREDRRSRDIDTLLNRN
ncbi:MAG: FtsQ-type POTRA domain-containing protein [Akkermansiaceae bacterium]|nr:FtsQ-type POTRA domain-containing protein [Akkermansiaceae bacterium]